MPAEPQPARRPPGHLVPGRRVVFLLALPLLLLLLAPAEPRVVWLAGLGDLLVLGLAFLDAELARLGRLEVERTFPSRLSVNIQSEVLLRVHSTSSRTLQIELHDQAPVAFRAQPERFELTVPPGGETTAVLRVHPPARGLYAWGSVFLRIRGPFGLSWAERRLPLACPVKVYPDVRASRLLLAGGVRDLSRVGAHTLRREGEGSELETLRDYVFGDPFRDIDWKATARREKPVVRVRQPERSQTVLVCVDASRLMAVKSGPLTKLDHAINAALLTAFVALRNDDRVGLMLFADDVHTFVPPGKGKGQYHQILERLYAATPTRTYVDYRAFARTLLARQPRRALILTLTEIHDEATTRPLMDQVRHIARRHLPVVISLRDPGLETAAESKPKTPDDRYRMAAAAELLTERAALQRGLSAAGARILDRSPEDAVLAAVNAYVEVKRRHLL